MAEQVTHTIDHGRLRHLDKDRRDIDGIRRYRRIRRWCYGRVLDFGCGSAYGSYLLAQSPYVTEVAAYDTQDSMTEFAAKQHGNIYPGLGDDLVRHKLMITGEIAAAINPHVDVLVAVEVVEHLNESGLRELRGAAARADIVIVTFPDLPTVAFNACHERDWVRQEVVDLFRKHHMPLHAFRIDDVQVVMMARRPVDAPGKLFRNLLDLK